MADASRPTRSLSRRDFLARSAAAGAAAWVAPTIVSLPGGRAWAAVYEGQPSVELSKTVTQVSREGRTLRVAGSIAIRNVSDAPATIEVESMKDTVWSRVNSGPWQASPTSAVTLPCPPGTTIPPSGSCSGPYEVLATVSEDATGLRNVVEVTVSGRDKVFTYREEVDFSE